MNSCKILGLDISTKSTGWCVMQYSKYKHTIVPIDYGLITRGNESIAENLVEFEQELIKIIKKYKPDKVAAEAPFVGQNRVTIQRLSNYHGVAMLLLAKHNLEVTYYAVMTLKSTVLGGLKAKKADGTKKTGKEMKKEVQNKVLDIVGKENCKKPYNDDITDAMSAVITFVMKDGESKKK